MKLTLKNQQDWVLTTLPVPAAPPRRGDRGVAAAGDLPAEFLLPGVEIDQRVQAVPTAPRRAAVSPAIDVSVDCAAGESAVIAARHDSGALTFHAPVQREAQPTRRGGGRSGGTTLHFRIAPRQSGGARRGMFGAAVKLILLKIKDAAVDAAVGAAVRLGGTALESFWWGERELQEGWFQVSAGQAGLRLRSCNASAFTGERSLLLLHGTFSDGAKAYSGLVRTAGNFFEKVRPIYGERIYAFNHFTVTRTPEENAQMLLAGLPDREHTFDVITHSRGGLVLRTLVEQSADLGPSADRFKLGQVVLVAAPNLGTPLATPGRWQETIGLVANLLEMFPDNPWTTGAAFVAHGITWLASSLIANLAGIASMDGAGPVIAALQDPGHASSRDYSVLAANYSPEDAIWRRLLDAGIDAFFAGANDLVVPSAGSWLLDQGEVLSSQAGRIGCFGPGGNLRQSAGTPVNHLNFFDQPETIQFLLQALAGPRQQLPPLDPLGALPWGKVFRGGGGRVVAGTPPQASPPERLAEPCEAAPPPPSGPEPPPKFGEGTVPRNTFHLIILDAADKRKKQILAIYDSARVLEEFVTANAETGARGRGPRDESAPLQPGDRFQRIIRTHKRIRMCLDGIAEKKSGSVPDLPGEEDLRQFGEHLFETLLTGRVRRLYDVARSCDCERRGEILNVVLTSTIPWLAALPWEFAFDPSRRKFLATEEVHFVRNVLTAVPAQWLDQERRSLQILVVSAQPQGTAELSIEEEEKTIRHRFSALESAGLATIDILAEATPARLHDLLEARQLLCRRNASARPYDIVHFIGHGKYDSLAQEGKLIFQTRASGEHEVDRRTLREILCDRGIQLVFLNACDTAQDDKDSLNRGVGQALVEGGMPAVVANQYTVLDSSAVGFADHFYWSLAQGASLGEAAREARIALNYAITHESIDWAIPVLFARDPTYRLCTNPVVPRVPPPDPPPREVEQPREARPAVAAAAKPVVTAANRPAGAAAKVIRVGVSDLAKFFPGLEQTLYRLNDVQDRFMFEAAEIVAPLGAWEVKNQDGHPHAYLHAERFAKLLQSKPKELGVDFLACVTNRRMRDNDYYDIYGWWSGKSELPILIFSTAGLALDPRGTAGDRTIANQLVESLAAQLLDAATGRDTSIHQRGPKDCPFYFNPDRELQYITGRRTFDEQCRKKLQGKLPKELDPAATLAAFESLLAAFDA